MSLATAYAQITIGGPCKITDGGNSFYFETGVKITPKPTWRAIPSSVAGEQDDTLVDLVYEISGRPSAVWNATYQGEFLPATLTNFTTTGVPLLGATNNAVAIIGADGNGFTFTRAVLTKMPSLFIGLGKPLFNSDAVWTAYLGNGNALTDTNAFYTLNTTAWSQSDYPTEHMETLGQLAWTATGWTSVFAEEGFMLTHESKLQPVKQGNITIDHKVIGYRGLLSFTPQQPTTAQLMAALGYQGTSAGIGSRRSANVNDAVVSFGSSNSITLKSAGLRVGSFNFDNTLNRHGEFSLVTALTTPGTRLALA